MKLKVLIACEESQRVCTAFRTLGHEAYSCDIQEPSGGHPEWHILGDVLPLLQPDDIGAVQFQTMDGTRHGLQKWDLIIAHPPCTYLSMVATRHHSLKCTPLEKINKRTLERINAMRFFMDFSCAYCEHIAIENPRGIMNTAYRQPDQIIDPYMFADSMDSEDYVTKATCLWLKNLPPLITNKLPKPNNKELFGVHPTGKARDWESIVTGGRDRAKNRSKTFEGIAKAMAIQWSEYIINEGETKCTTK